MPHAYTTTNPGDVRFRTRYIGIWVPGDERPFAEQAANPAGAPLPTIQVLEQTFVRLADRERKLEDLGDLAGTTFDPAEVFPLRDLATDAEIPGQTATAGQAMAILYAWVRHKQTLRDAAEDAPPAPITPEEPTP